MWRGEGGGERKRGESKEWMRGLGVVNNFAREKKSFAIQTYIFYMYIRNKI